MVEFDQIAQRVELRLIQLARIPHPQPVKVQAGVGHALQLLHLISQGLEHVLHHALAGFHQGHGQPAMPALPWQDVDLGRHRGAAIF
ncbi:MAG TPA: hypothetical protein PKU97_01290 [Kofleriaceae bacterium]|nr:hypothetical protein [Kofleriaceae bacterium]